MTAASEKRSIGLLAGVLAFSLWGAFPIYFKVATGVSAAEMLAHRVIWSVPFGLIILLARRQTREAIKVFAQPSLVCWLALSATVIALNWGVYIWTVQDSQIFQASLGYYINPLMLMLAGGLFLGERLRQLQVVAVVFAAAGVCILTVSGGVFPAIALVLAATFTIYSLIRKQTAVGAMPGLFVETVLLVPIALAYLGWLAWQSELVFASGDFRLDGLLLLAGPLTVLPLLFFAVAARRLSLTTIGFLQFIGPTGQLLVGLYYGETLTLAHLWCFGFIWCAVLVFIVDAYRHRVSVDELNTGEPEHTAKKRAD